MLYGAMCWKQVSRKQKTLSIILFYLISYIIISYVIGLLLLWESQAKMTFISDEFRVGDKYVLMFLVAPKTDVFTDVEGAEVFTSRKCEGCFITNNKGFLPLSEYDAVLVDRSLDETSGFTEPEKRYFIKARRQCLKRKLKHCIHQPIITSYTTLKTYDLCGLCKKLHKTRA